MASGTIKKMGVKKGTVTDNVTSSGNFDIGEFANKIIVGYKSSFPYGGFLFSNGNVFHIRFVQVSNGQLIPAPETQNVTVTYYYIDTDTWS